MIMSIDSRETETRTLTGLMHIILLHTNAIAVDRDDNHIFSAILSHCFDKWE